jgi:hypothetical protein
MRTFIFAAAVIVAASCAMSAKWLPRGGDQIPNFGF